MKPSNGVCSGQPVYQKCLSLVQYYYAMLRFNWSVLKARNSRKHLTTHDTRQVSIYPIPLGYANQIEVPFIPFNERIFDVSFAGSVVTSNV